MTKRGTATQTAGQQLAAMLRKVERIGTRTRRYRKGLDMHQAMIEAIRNATVYPGYWTGEKHAVLSGAWTVFANWSKHVDGGRIDPVLASKIAQLSPWRFAALLGEMVDAGVTNTGEGEIFFSNLKLS